MLKTNLNISDSEIKKINSIFFLKNTKYYRNDNFISKEIIEKHKFYLIEDLGETLANKVISANLYSILGIRCLYDGFYQITKNLDPKLVSCEKYTPYHNVERGPMVLIKIPGKRFVIKYFQNTQERKISKIASELELGPKIYGPNFELFEEHLGDEMNINLSPQNIGFLIGELFKKLHNQNIIYNEKIIGHLRYNKINRKIYLIDFGNSFIYDGKIPIPENYVWSIKGILKNQNISNFIKEKTGNKEIINPTTIDVKLLKLIELERCKIEIGFKFKSFIQIKAFKLYSRKKYIKIIQEYIQKGYDET